MIHHDVQYYVLTGMPPASCPLNGNSETATTTATARYSHQKALTFLLIRCPPSPWCDNMMAKQAFRRQESEACAPYFRRYGISTRGSSGRYGKRPRARHAQYLHELLSKGTIMAIILCHSYTRVVTKYSHIHGCQLLPETRPSVVPSPYRWGGLYRFWSSPQWAAVVAVSAR